MGRNLHISISYSKYKFKLDHPISMVKPSEWLSAPTDLKLKTSTLKIIEVSITSNIKVMSTLSLVKLRIFTSKPINKLTSLIPTAMATIANNWLFAYGASKHACVS